MECTKCVSDALIIRHDEVVNKKKCKKKKSNKDLNIIATFEGLSLFRAMRAQIPCTPIA